MKKMLSAVLNGIAGFFNLIVGTMCAVLAMPVIMLTGLALKLRHRHAILRPVPASGRANTPDYAYDRRMSPVVLDGTAAWVN